VHDWQFLARAHVIAMHRYIDDTAIDISFLDLTNESREPVRDLHAARRNPRQHYAFEVRVSFDDLVRNPAECLTDCFRVHDRDDGLSADVSAQVGGWVLFWFHGFLGDLAGSP
jgi:hypothetical protein